MSVIIVIFSSIFRLQDLIYQFAGLKRRLVREPPPVSPREVVVGDEWGFFIASTGLRLFYRGWRPREKEARDAVVLCVHGVGIDGRHFDVISGELANVGVETFALDLRGHGLSDGERADLSETGQIVREINDMREHIQGLRPGAPIFLLGESYAAVLAMQSAVERPQRLSGLILAGPEIAPSLRILTWAGFGVAAYLKYVPAVILDARSPLIDIFAREELISRIPRQRDEIDRMLGNDRTNGRTVLEGLIQIRRAPRIAPSIVAPTLVLQGGDDPLTKPEAAAKLRDGIEATDKMLIVFPGASHNLWRDPKTPKVAESIGDWVCRRSRKDVSR